MKLQIQLVCLCLLNNFIFLGTQLTRDFTQLNVLELFLDCITEPNEKLVEFGVGGICNACAGN